MVNPATKVDTELKFPIELFDNVCEHLQSTGRLKTLAQLLVCSHDTFDFAAPYLYREITLTRENASGIFHGIPLPPCNSSSSSIKIADDLDWTTILPQKIHDEWRTLYGDQPHLNREQHKTWPNHCHQEDEKERLECFQNSSAWTPNSQLHEGNRKIALLGHTKRLTFAELPSQILSEQLNHLSIHLKDQDHFPFENLTHLILQPRAFWTFANFWDFADEHVISRFLGNILPDNVCIQLPLLDDYLTKSYVIPRRLANSRDVSTGGVMRPHDPEDCFEIQLKDIFAYAIRSISQLDRRDLNGGPSLAIIVHNAVSFTGGYMPGHLPLRIFYRSCLCRDPIADRCVLRPKKCYRRYGAPMRSGNVKEIIIKILKGLDTLGDIVELIDMDWVQGSSPRDDPTLSPEDFHNEMIANARRVLDKYGESQEETLDAETIEKVLRSLAFTRSKDVAPCSCCGNSQLNYKESVIYPNSVKVLESENPQ